MAAMCSGDNADPPFDPAGGTTIADTLVLAPANYQRLLDGARAALATEANNSGDPQRSAALSAAAQLIESEQQMMALLSVQRHLLVGA